MFLTSNIRHLRKLKGLTQKELGEALGLKRAALATYEEGRAEPKLSTLLRMSSFFEVGVGELLENDLRNKNQALKRGPDVLSIAVNADGEEAISLIPEKAAAGYLEGFSDPEFIGNMEQFYLPFKEISKTKTYRIFETKGESMLPIPSGSYILGSYLSAFEYVKDGELYIILSRNEGIVFKRVSRVEEDNSQLLLSSDNQEFEAYTLPLDEVLEIWKADALISFAPEMLQSKKEVLNALHGIRMSVNNLEERL